MKKSFFNSFFILLVTVFSGTQAWSQLLESPLAATKPQFMAEIDYLANIFGQYYAPLLWKEQNFQFSVSAEVTKAKEVIEKCNDLQACRQGVVNFLMATRDYHVGYNFYSSETATLPFKVKTFENKTLIVEVDNKKLDALQFPLRAGDELVSLNGQSTADVLKELRAYEILNVAETDKSLADLSVTNRRGRKNHRVPRGPVMVKWKTQRGDEVSRQMIWEYTPDIFQKSRIAQANSSRPAGLQMLKTDVMEDKKTKPDGSPSKPSWTIGDRRSFLPDFGRKIWETTDDNPFYAYIFQDQKTGLLIGVLRLPSYTPDDASKSVLAFAEIVIKMQSLASALIIDQNSNPGGSVIYLYTLAAMLTGEPLYTPRHRMALTHSLIEEAVALKTGLKDVTNDEEAKKVLADTFGTYPVSYQTVVMMRDWSDFVVAQWRAGKKVSDPYFLWGIDQINPFPVIHYTGPLFVLTNELDFSGGDFFPAILQDNKRATIIGQRTAGAGGYVEELTFPNAFGLKTVSFTGSIAERISSAPIENLGVTPDHLLVVTEGDIRGGFVPYISEVLKIVGAHLQ